MLKKPFTTVAVVLFALMALVHVLRLMFSWEITVDGMTIPMWASAVGAIVAAMLAILVQREAGT